MKKKIIIVLLLLLVLVGCKNKDKEEYNESTNNVISIIGKSDDNRLVYKFKNDNKDTCYYLYDLTESGYTQYLFIIHSDEDEYNKYVEDNMVNVKTYDNTKVTRIKLNSVIKNSKDEDLKSGIKERNKDKEFIE